MCAGRLQQLWSKQQRQSGHESSSEVATAIFNNCCQSWGHLAAWDGMADVCWLLWCRFKFLWHDVVLVTDPAALASIMGRGEHSVDKAFETYAPINKMCDPHGQVGCS
jgi:hypothetical protein